MDSRKEKVIINVANGQKVNLMSATMDIGLESLESRVNTNIVAKTSNNISGGMKPINWLQIKDQWGHLRDIAFPKLGKRSKIAVLIGSNDYNLLFPMKDVRGGDNEPSVRLCPLGLTAIDTTGASERHGATNTGYLNTYRIQLLECSDGDLNYLLNNFGALRPLRSHRSNHSPMNRNMPLIKLSSQSGLMVKDMKLLCLGNMKDQNYRQTDRWQRRAFTQSRKS